MIKTISSKHSPYIFGVLISFFIYLHIYFNGNSRIADFGYFIFFVNQIINLELGSIFFIHSRPLFSFLYLLKFFDFEKFIQILLNQRANQKRCF